MATDPRQGDRVLALDQGTTSTRAVVFDRDGLPVATAHRASKAMFPSGSPKLGGSPLETGSASPAQGVLSVALLDDVDVLAVKRPSLDSPHL